MASYINQAFDDESSTLEEKQKQKKIKQDDVENQKTEKNNQMRLYTQVKIIFW